jgi:carbonic anhydrase
MMTKMMGAALACVALLGACASDSGAEKATVPATKEVHEDTLLEIARQTHDYAKWSYGGGDGPDKWGALDSHYAVCGGGPFQSPIDFKSADARAHHTDLHIEYIGAKLRALNNGHTVQLNAEEEDDRLLVNGHAYKLIQLHIHAPSEHRFGGETFPMEVHFVHIDEYDHLAVLGLPLKVGAENPILKPLFDDLPEYTGKPEPRPVEQLDLPSLVPDETHFFHYQGSLTTPPCTENVQWFVLETPAEVSQEQVDAFLAVVHENSRPAQPMNNRVLVRNVVAGEGEAPTE